MAIYRVVIFDCITLYILRVSECNSGVHHLSSCFRHLLVQNRTQKGQKWDQQLKKWTKNYLNWTINKIKIRTKYDRKILEIFPEKLKKFIQRAFDLCVGRYHFSAHFKKRSFLNQQNFSKNTRQN